jgi:hypothetical protein
LQEMPESLRAECSEGPGIERAEPNRSLAPLDRAFSFCGPAMDDTAEDEAQRGGGAERECRLGCRAVNIDMRLGTQIGDGQ